MSRPVLSKGMLVRQKSISGAPIGPWLRIIYANAFWVYTEIIALNKNNQGILKRERVWIPNHIRLPLQREIVIKIRDGKQHKIYHQRCALWTKKLFKSGIPDLITFYTTDGREDVTVAVDLVEPVIVAYEKLIKVSIDRVIL